MRKIFKERNKRLEKIAKSLKRENECSFEVLGAEIDNYESEYYYLYGGTV